MYRCAELIAASAALAESSRQGRVQAGGCLGEAVIADLLADCRPYSRSGRAGVVSAMVSLQN